MIVCCDSFLFLMGSAKKAKATSIERKELFVYVPNFPGHCQVSVGFEDTTKRQLDLKGHFPKSDVAPSRHLKHVEELLSKLQFL